MKKILLAFFILIGINGKAQITLDHAWDTLAWGYTFKPVQISSTETKYFFSDTINTFSLYNMDFTPFITNIVVPEAINPSGNLFQVLYVTRTLFDCDSTNIEYAFYSPSNRNKPFRVIRTDGTIIFQKDSANGPYCYGNCLGGTDAVRPIVNTSSGAKLFLQSASANPGYQLVYSLCGELPTQTFDFTNQTMQFVQVYPNPSSQTLTFEINPPSNMEDYELVIVDNAAREVKREKINGHSNRYTIDVRPLSSGSYIYSLCSKNKAYQTGKFVINK